MDGYCIFVVIRGMGMQLRYVKSRGMIRYIWKATSKTRAGNGHRRSDYLDFVVLKKTESIYV